MMWHWIGGMGVDGIVGVCDACVLGGIIALVVWGGKRIVEGRGSGLDIGQKLGPLDIDK